MRAWLNKHPGIEGVVWVLGFFALLGLSAPPFLYLMKFWWALWLP